MASTRVLILAFLGFWAAVGHAEPRLGRHFLEGLGAKNFAQVKADIKEGRIAGVVIFGDAFRDGADLRVKIAELKAAAPGKLIVAIDGEGGEILRLPGIEASSAEEMGMNSLASTRDQARAIAGGLSDFGFNLNLAPVVDLGVEKSNPLRAHGRIFSSDAKAVAARAAVFVSEMKKAGIQAVLKHFPGHGSSKTDSHTDTVDVTATWTERELEPYRALIAAGFRGGVMTGHLFQRKLDPKYPATLSAKIIGGVLRGKLGFKGFVVTDDMQMGAISRHYSLTEAVRLALEAGNDLILIGQRFRNDDLAALENDLAGKIPAALLTASDARLQ